jgi:hypothetical protein
MKCGHEHCGPSVFEGARRVEAFKLKMNAVRKLNQRRPPFAQRYDVVWFNVREKLPVPPHRVSALAGIRVFEIEVKVYV